MRHELTEALPISEALFACMLRLGPSEVGEFASGLPENRRVPLALFCFARAHLRPVGLLIGRECGKASLVREGGQAGLSLFEQAHGTQAEPVAPTQMRRQAVSLSRSVRTATTWPAMEETAELSV